MVFSVPVLNDGPVYLEQARWLSPIVKTIHNLIFKVTPALWNFQILTKKKSLSASYLLNQMTDSGQNFIYYNVGMV